MASPTPAPKLYSSDEVVIIPYNDHSKLQLLMCNSSFMLAAIPASRFFSIAG